MSLPTKRTALVDALTATGVVNAYPYPTSTTRPGDAWPLWAGAAAPESGPYATAFVQTWQVHVVLPPDPQAADEWTSDHVDQLVDALSPHLQVTGYAPARITPQGTAAAYNALIINGETE